MYVMCSSARMPGQGLCLPSQKPACGSRAIIASKKRLLKASNKDSFLLALVSKETLLCAVLCGQSMANGMNKDPGCWLLRRPPRHPLIARLVVYIHLTLTCRLPTAGLLSPGSWPLAFPRRHLGPFFCLPSLHQLHCPVMAPAFGRSPLTPSGVDWGVNLPSASSPMSQASSPHVTLLLRDPACDEGTLFVE